MSEYNQYKYDNNMITDQHINTDMSLIRRNNDGKLNE